MIGFVVVWNLVGFIAFRLDGHNDGHFHTLLAAILGSLDCAILAVAGFGSLKSEAIRRFVLRSDANLIAARPGLRFIGTLGTFIAVILPFSVGH
jgi:hypothetical protein